MALSEQHWGKQIVFVCSRHFITTSDAVFFSRVETLVISIHRSQFIAAAGKLDSILIYISWCGSRYRRLVRSIWAQYVWVGWSVMVQVNGIDSTLARIHPRPPSYLPLMLSPCSSQKWSAPSRIVKAKGLWGQAAWHPNCSNMFRYCRWCDWDIGCSGGWSYWILYVWNIKAEGRKKVNSLGCGLN